MDKEFSNEEKEKYNPGNCVEKSELDYFSIMGFHLPLAVKTTDYYKIDTTNIKTDSLTARKLAQRQLEYMISYDTKLKKEVCFKKFKDFGTDVEPEMIDFDNDTCYYTDHHGNMYKLYF